MGERSGVAAGGFVEDLRGVKLLKVVEGFWVWEEKDKNLEGLKAKGFLLRVESDEVAVVAG